jgi:hypothetical protein
MEKLDAASGFNGFTRVASTEIALPLRLVHMIRTTAWAPNSVEGMPPCMVLTWFKNIYGLARSTERIWLME